MPTEAKRETVAELREELANARTMIVSEYRGLKVKEIAEIRRALRKQDVTYRVVKNRLMRIAAEDSVGAALSPLADRADRDRVRHRRGRDREGRPRCHSTLRQGRPDHRRRARRPGDQRRGRHPAGRHAPREVLLARLAGGMQAPVGTLAGLFVAPLRNLGYALQQVAEQKARREPP